MTDFREYVTTLFPELNCALKSNWRVSTELNNPSDSFLRKKIVVDFVYLESFVPKKTERSWLRECLKRFTLVISAKVTP